MMFAALVVVLAGSACGVAFAYWRATGSGTGQATAGATDTLYVQTVAGGSPATMLQPGAAADLLVQVSNPSTHPMIITSVTQNGTIVVVSGGACTAANAAVTVPTAPALTIAVPANGASLVHLPGAVAMGASSDSSCQGKSFTIPVTLTVQR